MSYTISASQLEQLTFDVAQAIGLDTLDGWLSIDDGSVSTQCHGAYDILASMDAMQKPLLAAYFYN